MSNKTMTLSQEIFQLVNQMFPQCKGNWEVDTKKKRASVDINHTKGKVRIEVNGFQHTLSVTVTNSVYYLNMVTADREQALATLEDLYLPTLREGLEIRRQIVCSNPEGLNN